MFTREFIDDLGITDVRQLVEYSVNSEVDTQARNSGTEQNAFINPQNLNGNVLTRGISASQGMDYFPSIAPLDSYRVGCYDDSRGPNRILFGIGSVGGIINQSSKTAVTLRDSATVRHAFGRWDRNRIEIDANRVVLRDRLALSVAGLRLDHLPAGAPPVAPSHGWAGRRTARRGAPAAPSG